MVTTANPRDAHPDESSLRRYLSATSALGPHWRADGAAFAFVWNEPGSYHVYVAEQDGSGTARVQRVTGGDDRCTDPRFLADGSIVYSTDAGGNENFQLHLATPTDEGWRTRRLTKDTGAKHRVLSCAPEEILFIANDADRSRFTLYAQTLPPQEWAPRALFTPERGVLSRADRLGDGRVVVELAYGTMHQELLLLDGRPRSLTRALDGGAEVRWELLRAAPNGRLLAATDLDRDTVRPVLLSMDGALARIPAVEARPDAELGGTAHLDDHPEIWIELNEEGYSRLYRLTECSEAGELEEIDLPFAGAVVSGDARTSRIGFALSPGGARIAVAFGGPAEVANIWIRDLTPGRSATRAEDLAPADADTGAAGGWMRVTDATVPGIDRESLVDCRLERFESFDGLSVPYFTYVPRESAGAGDDAPDPLPAVVLIHGGPEAQSRPAFNNVVQFLVAGGFAVVVPNIRGSAGYGRRYLDLDNREKRLDATRDIAELARHLARSNTAIDGERLAVMGGSYGGFAVLSALTEHPELWKAGVDIVGISNFVTFLTNTAAWRRSLRESEYGSLADRELLERISPINRIERIAAPLLIIQGDNDERVPLSESVQMHDRLRELGRTVELLRFADEGHGVTKLENRIVAYTRVAEWLRTHL